MSMNESGMHHLIQGLELPVEVKERVENWLQEPYDIDTRNAVEAWVKQANTADLLDAFYKDLAFGTGGLRGVLGVGTNRMNTYTVGKATQGLANYLKKQFPEQPIRVAISYDSRNKSDVFARLIAAIFIKNEIDVYIFDALRPTPQLSFAIRQLECHAGVMVTASHNPKEYNGYKAYWSDGGQLVHPHDKGVMDCVNSIQNPSEVHFPSEEDLAVMDQHERFHTLGRDMDEAYFHAALALSIRPEVAKNEQRFKVVYSPIHGTGVTLVPTLLQRWGFHKVHVVEAQSIPDGNFPTVVYPNPEEEEAMKLAIAEAKNVQADLVLATDPDADRVGMAIQDEHGDFELLNGNQIGSLLVDYVLSSYHEKGMLRPNDYVVKTIVTTDLIAAIANDYNVPCPEVLTGFKYIGELMTQKAGEMRFLVGGEESFGYLVGDLVRDKDAVISCAFIAEMVAYHHSQGKTVKDALIDLYIKHGFYKERLISITKKGKAGADAIKNMMEKLRNQPIQSLGGIQVVRQNDYWRQEALDVRTKAVNKIELPKSDVLQYVTIEGDVISVRPSGTEPKIKFYCSVREPLTKKEDYEQVNANLEAKIDRMMNAILQD